MEAKKYKAKNYYQDDSIVQAYDSDRFESWYGKMAHQIELNALNYAINHYFDRGGTILDLPCGTGRLLQAYQAGEFEVTGGDISNEMLDVARERFKSNPLFSFERCDAEALDFSDNAFDYLVSFRLMCHLPAEIRRTVLLEMLRVTKKVLVLNYHFDVNTPLLLFNKMFRSHLCSPYPLIEKELRQDLASLNVEFCEIRKLSWYERSSALVIIRKLK